MPHALSITDGSTTVSLSTTNAILEHYVPQTPKRTGPGELDFAPVEEPIELAFVGASTSAIQSTYNSVQALLLAAARRQAKGVGSRVFLQYQPIGDGTLWRSEILDGDARLGDSAMSTFGSLVMRARLQVQRRPWWEGSRTAVPLTNGNGSNNTSGLTIKNHDDGNAGDDNYLGISAGNVGGVLPTPAEIQLTNTNGATIAINSFTIANNIFDPSFTHILEGESRLGGYGSVQSAATCSNGQLVRLTGTGSIQCAWSLSSGLLQASEGRFFNLVARIPTFATSPGVYCTAMIKDANNLVTLAMGKEMKLTLGSSYLQILGTLPLPPGGFNTAYAGQTLFLQFRTTAAETIEIDYIQLTPSEELCWRQVLAMDTGHVANSIFVDDGIEGLTYRSVSGAAHPIYDPKGTPVHLFPGVNQRLYVLMDGLDATIDKSMSAKVWYRPRRLSI